MSRPTNLHKNGRTPTRIPRGSGRDPLQRPPERALPPDVKKKTRKR